MASSRFTQRIAIIRSDKDTHFSGALAQNAAEQEALAFPGNLRTNELIIEAVTVQSDQNLEWDLVLWKAVAGANADLDLDNFVDYINFPATSGKQIAGAGQYYYASAASLAIPYKDEGAADKATNASVHCSLVNRSVTGKNAGATGEVVVTLFVRPVYGI